MIEAVRQAPHVFSGVHAVHNAKPESGVELLRWHRLGSDPQCFDCPWDFSGGVH
jgi:hypothetical protein